MEPNPTENAEVTKTGVVTINITFDPRTGAIDLFAPKVENDLAMTILARTIEAFHVAVMQKNTTGSRIVPGDGRLAPTFRRQ